MHLQTIVADRKNVERIIRFLLTKHWWFQCKHSEGMYELSFAESIALDDLRTKIKGVEFTV